MLKALHFAWRNSVRQPARTCLGVLGVAAVGALLFDMLLLSHGLVLSFRDLLDRAGFDVRHRVQMNGSASLPWQLRLSPLITLSSGRPYNITTGRDLNGDGLFNDRPAFATDLNRPSVVHTGVGAFDLAPLAGQTIVPRNYGQGPGQAIVNMRLSKTIAFGEKQLAFTVNARNAINHPNFGWAITAHELHLVHEGLVFGSGPDGFDALPRQMSLHEDSEFHLVTPRRSG
jgi:hypothetical protein